MEAPAAKHQPAKPRDTRRRRGIIAIVALTIAWATVMQALGWAQTSYYAMTRALSHGTAQIDRYSWETRDAAYTNGNFYSVKAPGLPMFVLPFYEVLNAVGGKDVSRDMAQNAHRSGAWRWYKAGAPSLGNYGYDLGLARRVRADIENFTPMVWMLGLFGTVIPAMIMLLLVRSFGERLEVGFGTVAAITLGVGTMVMPFATLFFGHVLSALLGFGCFALLWKEREGPPRLGLLALAGLLAGLAVTTEYPLALVGIVCGVYAISRDSWGNWLRRGLTFSAGAIAGVIPLFAYNFWAFGSLTHFSYENAIAKQGLSGHEKLGLNDGGFFGIGAPSLQNTFDLLLSSKGLFVLSPVLAMALIGTALLYKRGRRAEALAIGGVFAVYLLYNSGYWLPFGGGSPGPRFLFPVLPFIAVPLAIAWKRYPATTLALAIPSALTMVSATITLPMIGNGDVGYWVHLIGLGNFQHSIVSVFGGDNGWLSTIPFFVAMAVAIGMTISATGAISLSRDATASAVAVVVWGIVASVTPRAPEAQAGAGHDFLPLIGIAVAASLLTVAIGVLLERRYFAPPVAEAPGDT